MTPVATAEDEATYVELARHSTEAQLLPEEAARVMAACDVLARSARERADALVAMAEGTLRGDKPERPPVEIVVHNGISAETARRLLCDASALGESAERESRVFAGALRRALLARAGGCCDFPGARTRTRLAWGAIDYDAAVACLT